MGARHPGACWAATQNRVPVCMGKLSGMRRMRKEETCDVREGPGVDLLRWERRGRGGERVGGRGRGRAARAGPGRVPPDHRATQRTTSVVKLSVLCVRACVVFVFCAER